MATQNLDKYAIIKSGNRQYWVTEGQIVLLDKLATGDDNIILDHVLLIKDNKKVEIGTPVVDGVVKASVIDQVKGKKVQVSKYKAKTGYRRKVGFRPVFTKVKIEEISLKGK